VVKRGGASPSPVRDWPLPQGGWSPGGEVGCTVASRGWHHKCYSVIAITLHYVFAFLHNALYLWRIVIALDFSWALSLPKVIALRLQVSAIALSNKCKRYHFKGSNDIILTIMLPCYLSIPLPYCREKRDNSVQKLYFLLQKFKRALLFLCYHITLCPNVETLLPHIVNIMYRYHFVSLSLQENW